MHRESKNISSQDGTVPAAMSGPRVLIAAGGTGGHVYPAIAIADALRNEYPEVEILFVGTKNHMEWYTVTEAGFDIVSIWISGFHRELTVKNLLFPLKLITSLIQSFLIIGKFNPDVAVSCGGYVAGPVGWIAAKRNVPLVIQEQNSYPGVTNRLLARHAEFIFTAFKDADRYFPTEKTQLTGNPTRRSLTEADTGESYRHFSLNPDISTLLVLGGSGGARSINEAMFEHIKKFHDDLEIQIIWQCGEKYFDELNTRVGADRFPNLRLKSYIKNMAAAYAVADLVVSRAGALSCSELALTGKPAVLIPSPHVAADHQTKNARSMVDSGAAVLLKDNSAKDLLPETVEKILFDPKRLEKMKNAAKDLARPNAARDIARDILKLTKAQQN